MRHAPLKTPLLRCLVVTLLGTAVSTALADRAANPQAAQIRAAVAEVVAEADAGHDVGAIVNAAGELGIDAATAAAHALDPAKPARAAAICELIAQATQSRRANAELLKLYDPSAYRLFYTQDGLEDQRLIGRVLDNDTWPPRLPEAVVRGAPVPALAWLKAQAASPAPRIAQLILIWKTWGFWARVGHERQYTAALGPVIAELAGNKFILANAAARAALCRFAGEAKAAQAVPFVIDTLEHGQPAARAEAAAACGHLARHPHESEQGVEGTVYAPLSPNLADDIRNAIVAAALRESDESVQQKIAAAADAWPDDKDIAQAILTLFNRNTSAATRREVMFSVGSATWPNRADLLLRAFDVPDDGVLGAALIALAIKPEPRTIDKMIDLAAATAEGQPPLIDALGAAGDKRAVPHLERWLDKETNPAVRVKILLALEHTTKHEADALFLKIIGGEASAMTVEQTIGIIARKQIAGGEATLIALATDASAPIQVRIEAIWAMGRFNTPAVRETLTNLNREGEKYFDAPKDARGNPAPSETLDMARMMVALAKIQLHETDGPALLQTAFNRGTATAKLTALIMLAQIGVDHPIIAQGLASTDMAVILGSTKAAAASDPKKYLATLLALRASPFMNQLLHSGLDAGSLHATLDEAIEAGSATAGGKP